MIILQGLVVVTHLDAGFKSKGHAKLYKEKI
jgi:hypothetical protein